MPAGLGTPGCRVLAYEARLLLLGGKVAAQQLGMPCLSMPSGPQPSCCLDSIGAGTALGPSNAIQVAGGVPPVYCVHRP
jgi:hypothetical protein